jgi:16S rRNA (adenine1518-N6/adenine1519-N6)-dimethyltransferase
MIKEKKQRPTTNVLLAEVRRLCDAYGVWPAKNKGQHFLIDEAVLDAIIQTAHIKSDETIVEIGPGLGILTRELVRLAGRVISIELDHALLEVLRPQFAGEDTLTIVEGNALQFDPATYNIRAYSIVANLPYNITAHFFRTFLTAPLRPNRIVVLIQKEVAQRICAKPGEHSLLSLSAQLYAVPRYIQTVGREAFWPQPKVTSAILAVDNIKSSTQVAAWLGDIPEAFFWRIVRIGFSSRRKILAHNLAAGLRAKRVEVDEIMDDIGLNAKCRAQELALDQWRLLAKKLKIFSNTD